MRDWYHRILALCQSRLVSFADAEDAVQETFMRALNQLESLRDPASMGGWLRQIAHNVCIDTIRRQSLRRAGNDVDAIPEPESTAGRVDTTDEREYLIGLVHQLPEPLREIVLLHYFQEMSYDEMASWLNVARSTVNDRLSKARVLLRRKLEGHVS